MGVISKTVDMIQCSNSMCNMCCKPVDSQSNMEIFQCASGVTEEPKEPFSLDKVWSILEIAHKASEMNQQPQRLPQRSKVNVGQI
jgi:hypothetical protein